MEATLEQPLVVGGEVAEVRKSARRQLPRRHDHISQILYFAVEILLQYRVPSDRKEVGKDVIFRQSRVHWWGLAIVFFGCGKADHNREGLAFHTTGTMP